jgi:hypothetical protein
VIDNFIAQCKKMLEEIENILMIESSTFSTDSSRSLYNKFEALQKDSEEVACKYRELIANTDCAILLGKLDEKRHEMARKFPSLPLSESYFNYHKSALNLKRSLVFDENASNCNSSEAHSSSNKVRRATIASDIAQGTKGIMKSLRLRREGLLGHLERYAELVDEMNDRKGLQLIDKRTGK